MTRAAGTRALLRLAIRDARRDRWRSLLVLVVVALPVAGVVAGAALADSTSPTAEENAVSMMGRADAVLWPWGEPPADGATLADLLPDLPAGAEVEVAWSASTTLVADGLQRPLQLTDVDLTPEAIADGRVELVAGERPQVPEAVALSSELLIRSGAALGDRVRVEPIGELTVVGEVRDPERLSRSFGVVMPGGVAGVVAGAHPDVLLTFADGVVPDLGPQVAFGSGEGTPVWTGRTREQLLEERFGRSQRWTFVVIGGLAAVEVALVAGAAFAVSVRRRQRELGLLAATGGTIRQVRRGVLLTGVAVGTVGAVAGLAAGMLAARLLLPWASGLSDRVASGLRLDPTLLVAAALIGGLAAVAGAWWPARNVARLPVLTALSGRRPTPTRARNGLAVGLVLAAGGAGVCVLAAGASLAGATPFVFLLGSVAVVLGAGLTSPWLLEQLGRTAGRLPAGPRLAVRDAARFRSRNGPIVTAAMAGLAASVTLTAILGSIDARDLADYRPPLPSHLLVVEADTVTAGPEVAADTGLTAVPFVAPDADVVVSGTVGADGGMDAAEWVDAVVDDGTLAGLLADDRAAALLEAGQAVGLRPEAPSEVEVRARDADGNAGEVTATFEVVSVGTPDDAEHWMLPDVLLPATAVDAPPATRHLLHGDGPLDDATVAAAAAAATGIGEFVHVTAERSYYSESGAVTTGITIAGGIGGLAIVAVAIALAAAESRGDLRILAAVGAGARTRRSLAAGRALLLAGLGGLLAVPVGLVPAVALLSVIDGGIPLVLPWTTIVVVAVVVPLLACGGSVLASRRDPGVLSRAA